MTARPSMFMVIMAALALGWAGSAGAATAAEKCEANKLKASSDKAKCLLRAEADSVLTGQPPNTAPCVADFEAAFAAAEQNAGPGVCPTEGDVNVNAIEALIDACRDDVADALQGFPPAPCGQFPATGQTNSFQAGDDGDLEAGATLSYTDTGNGTITDNNTGLEWEKKTAANVGNIFSWINAFAYIDSLNTEPCFAGQCDWRPPNVKELQSIVDYGRSNPSIDPIFGPTAASFYWSSFTIAGTPASAWVVRFVDGLVFGGDKGILLRVRAVRGGS